ncbi:MAG: hypothetical protein A2177_11110 [Spirochaetes bacterium RBG_13_68_11]|nr:MAG: hypothetical protein A2177_11110 [Spirochaetes bacterium RBG_13_68_11]
MKLSMVRTWKSDQPSRMSSRRCAARPARSPPETIACIEAVRPGSRRASRLSHSSTFSFISRVALLENVMARSEARPFAGAAQERANCT